MGLADIHQFYGIMDVGHSHQDSHGHLGRFAVLTIQKLFVSPAQLHRHYISSYRLDPHFAILCKMGLFSFARHGGVSALRGPFRWFSSMLHSPVLRRESLGLARNSTY